MEYGQAEGNFDFVITNDRVERAYKELRRFLLCHLRRAGPRHLQPSCLVVCGPSGAGVTSMVRRLVSANPDYMARVVSHTTRQQRPGEVEGEDYYFVTDQQMDQLETEGEFLESVTYAGNRYGTSETAIQQVVASAKIAVMEMEVRGVCKVRERQEELGKVQYVFIAPSSPED